MESSEASPAPAGPAAKEWRRFRGLELHQQGWKQKEIAAALGVSPGAVSQWVVRARTHGPEALRHTKGGGPKPKLTAPQWQQLLQEILPQGAGAFGFIGKVWTLPRIATVIFETFGGVRYHPDWLSHKMRSLGWSVQKPETRRHTRQSRTRRVWKPSGKGGLR